MNCKISDLKPDSRGFLVTCEKNREILAAHEITEFLNQVRKIFKY